MNFSQLFKIVLEDNTLDMDLDFSIDNIDLAAKSIFASIWADWAEQELTKSFSGQELTEVAPDYNKYMPKKDKERFENKIYSMIQEFEALNRKDIKDLYHDALRADNQDSENPDEDSGPDTFIYYVLMKILGHGVSWEDSHQSANFKYPHTEMSYLEFPDTFPEMEESYEDHDWDEEEKEEDAKDTEGEEWKGNDYLSDPDFWKK